MQIRIGMESGVEGRSLAWGLDYPGCFSYGADDTEALLTFPQALLRYAAWLNLNAGEDLLEFHDLDFRMAEAFSVYTITDQHGEYDVNAFFEDDARALDASEIERTAAIFTWQRAELLAGVETLPAEQLTACHPGENRTIVGIVEHIARVERWYLEMLNLEMDAFTQGDSPVALLEITGEKVLDYLPGLAGCDLVTTHRGERWSPRKFVRRLLWHQRDHIDHIRKIVGII